MIDFKFENTNEPGKGSLLVSEPFLTDQYFSRAVIFLCDHNESGSFGFVLNNYIETELHDILNGFPDVETKVSIGGPVDTSNLFFIHGLGDEIPDSLPIIEGLYIGGKFEHVQEAIEKDPAKIEFIRFFIGYSGWEAEQLDKELNEHSWIVLNNCTSDTVFRKEESDIWTELMEDLGGKFKIMSTFPKNPSDN